MNQNNSDQPPQNQQQRVGDVQIQGNDNIFNTIQAQIVALTQTKIIQISADEIKTRELIITSPYKGLKTFEPEDADRFFGRDQFLTGLVNELEQTNFMLLLGASGSGKSSVVRAGLIPWLREKWGNRFVSLMLTPDRDPFESFYGCLLSRGYKQAQAQLARAGQVDTLSQAIKRLKEPESLWLIFIDQFEELFTISQSEKRDRFIQGLHQLSKEKIPGLRIVATMRSDFLNYLDPFPANLLVSLTQKHRPLITQMHTDELRLVIEQPAAHHGVVFETGLVEEIIKDVQGQAGYLPLLQYTLDLLWESEVKDGGIQDRTLNKDSYRRLGGVRGALKQHMDQIYQDLPKPEQLAAQRIFLKLVEINGNEATGTEWKPVRRRASRAEFQDEMEQTVLTTLINQKLLVSDAPVEGKRQPTVQGATVELAHEILLTSWTTLSSWIQENRQSIALRNRLNHDVELWQVEKADSDLWSGAKLTQVLELRNNSTFQQVLGGFSDIANQFIDASVELKNRQQQQKERQRRRIVTGLAGFSVAALMLSGFALYQLQRAQRQRVEQLAATSQALAATQPVEATVNALAAVGLSRSPFVQLPDRPQFASVESSLLNAIQTNRERSRLLHTDEVFPVAISADGKTIVSGGQDGTVLRWNAQTGAPIGQPLTGHSGSVASVAISADGKIIVSGGQDGTVRRWNAQTGTPIGRSLSHYAGWVFSVAISADGKIIVSGGQDGTIRRWNAQTGAPIGPLAGHYAGVYSAANSSSVRSVAMSADGNTIVSCGDDGTVRLWNAQTKELTSQPLTGHSLQRSGGLVCSVAISADGNTIVGSGGEDNNVHLWNTQTGDLTSQPLAGHSRLVRSVAISADGKTLVSGGQDGTVRLWNTGASVGHPLDSVASAAISADGKTLVSGGYDGTVRLWNAQTGELIGQPVTGHSDSLDSVAISALDSVAISADGKTLVTRTRGRNGTVRLWNAQTGELIGQLLTGPFESFDSIAISADGKTIVSGGFGTVRLWNAQTGAPIGQPLTDQSSWFISADGKTLVSGGSDGTVRRWNAQTGELIGQPLTGHSGSIHSVVISADGKTIVSSGEDITVRLWNAQTGAPIGQPLTGHSERDSIARVNSVAISADGKTIVSGGFDGTVRRWNAQTGTPIGQPLTGHSGSVASVAISADGKTIVSGGDDGTVRIWNAQTETPIGQPLTDLNGVSFYFVAISADGKTLVGKTNSLEVWRWAASPEQWVKIACEQLQYHSILTNSPTDVAKEARSTCQKFVW